MNQWWHSSKDFNKKIKDYHNKYARPPNVAYAKAKLESLKEEIRNQMDAQGLFKCMGFKYKGSTYERVKIINSEADCPEFDLDFIIRGGEFLVASTSENGWHKLQVKWDKPHNLSILDRAEVYGTILPDRVMQLFYGSLTKCEFITKYNVKLRYHGPAVQLDVHHQNSNKLWFQVDLAPAFYLEGTNPNERFSDCYIAKSPDDISLQGMWYRSYSIDEKIKLVNASGQRKVVLRTLKAMRGGSAQLSGLQSYHFKMALLFVMEQFPNDLQWTDDKTGQRLIDVLLHMHKCLNKDFNQNLNIFKLSDKARTNLENQIYRLVTNEKSMNDFLGIQNLLITNNNGSNNDNNNANNNFRISKLDLIIMGIIMVLLHIISKFVEL